MKKSKDSPAAAAALGDLFEGIEASGVMDERSLAADGFLDSARPNAPKYSRISVKLTGSNGNAFAIMGRVRAALRENGVLPPRLPCFSPKLPRAITTTCYKRA